MAGKISDVRLENVLAFANGQSSPERTEKGRFAVYGSNGIIGGINETNSGPNTIVIGRVGSFCGSLHFSKKPCWVTDNAIRASAISGNNPRYLLYLLTKLNLHQWRGGSGQPLLNQRTLNAIETKVHSQPQQDEIAGILGSLDDKIELNRRTNNVLEGMARAIFKAWFVDFEPVKAKAAGATSFPGMPQPVFNQLPNAFIDSELGEIPEGWALTTMSEIAALSRDSTTPSDSPDTEFEHFSIPAYDASRHPEIEYGNTIKSAKYRVPNGCVLVSKLNPRFPRVCMPQPSERGLSQICSTEFLVASPCAGWSREYVYCQVSDDRFRQHLMQHVSGTSSSHQRVKPSDFEATKVVEPDRSVRVAFDAAVAKWFSLLVVFSRESRILVSIRDMLLPKLISGEIAVPVVNGDNNG